MPARHEQFGLLFEAAPNGMLVVDWEGRITLANRQIEELFGYSRDELIGRPVEMLMPERFRSAHPLLRRQYNEAPLTRPMGAGRDLFGLRKDGSDFPIEIGLNPFQAKDGQLVLASIVDITERRRHEEYVQVIMHELAHRSKNLLTIVMAIAQQTIKHSISLDDFKGRFEARLFAISQSQELLFKRNWIGVPVDELVNQHLKPFIESGARIEPAGPPIVLKPDLAQRIGLALHELATNATKYGSLSSPTGKVVLSWEADDQDNPIKFRMSWSEQGGPPVKPPDRQGFGYKLLTRMKDDGLCDHVKMDFAPEGLIWQVECPESQLVKK